MEYSLGLLYGIREEGFLLVIKFFMECVRPIGDTLGLDDCLACSGCVSVAEPNAQRHQLGIEKIKGDKKIGIVFTPQSKIALYERIGIGKKEEYVLFEKKLLFFLRKHKVIDSSYGTRILLEKEIGKKTTTISSMCPGVVAYAETTAHHLVPYLSKTFSPVEICAYKLKKESFFVVSVTMCKDKRMEAEKRDIVDCCITTNEFYNAFYADLDIYPSSSFSPDPLSLSSPLPGLSSGGIFEGILAVISEESIISRKEKDNYKEIVFMHEGETKKIAQVHGLPRVISFSMQAKSQEFIKQFLYVEMMICRKGCLYGPSQGVISSFSAYSGVAKENIPGSLGAITEKEIEKNFAVKIKSKTSFAVQW